MNGTGIASFRATLLCDDVEERELCLPSVLDAVAGRYGRVAFAKRGAAV